MPTYHPAGTEGGPGGEGIAGFIGDERKRRKVYKEEQ